MTSLTTEQMDALQAKINNNDISEFYDSLWGYGDLYGRLGHAVTTEYRWQGQLANNFLYSAIADNKSVEDLELYKFGGWRLRYSWMEKIK